MEATIPTQTKFLILGTAGHIDHGKTSLVRQLTGIDTDRLPEEKRRGITIDIGFANLDLPGIRFGIVDVPGHERFVHNMVAGATGVDLAMLVVAADDSVMPQTTEHLAILQQLGISQGLVVVTKIDLVDSDHLELVIEELRELLAGTFLADAPIVPVSSQSGEGLDCLKETLTEIGATFQRNAAREVFRMSIDRVFSIQGHGTVVTGTVSSGTVAVGDSILLAPQNESVRVRRLQSHSQEVSEVCAGQRAAINLAGIKNEEIRRGNELSATGYLQPSQRVLVKVEMLASASKALSNRQLVRLHIGTQEHTVRVILRASEIYPGESGFAELRCKEPILSDHGQRFILRQPSPVITIGGGIILDPAIDPHRRIKNQAELGEKLVEIDPAERLSAYLEDHDVNDLTPPALACRLGIDPRQRDELVAKLVKDKRLISLPGSKGMLIHQSRRDRLAGQIAARCQRELKQRQPSRFLERSILVGSSKRLAPIPIVEAMIDDLIAGGTLVKHEDRIGLPGVRATLTKGQQKTLTQLVELCKTAGAAPPLVNELAQQLSLPAKEVESLLKVAVEDGLLLKVGEGLFYTADSLENLRQKAVERIRTLGPSTVAELRDAWGVSRKHAVPLCEYLDSEGVTVRSGDSRVAGPNFERPILAK